ncbi:sensor histidine kinase [Rhodovulum sp. DZ06]|uniref:sensor histidine kinase n=1 Tax=Rhodovulum sp. DZ06 TaxID=3425126 RepID=UPI003D341E22
MRRRLALAAVLLCALPAAAGGIAWRASLEDGLSRARAAAAAKLEAAAQRLDGQIARYRQLPRVLADAAPLAEAAAEPTVARTARLNALLERIADVTGALDIYVMDSAGWTVAASNWASEQTFIGRNFAFRPYFQRAMDGGLGSYYALGTTSLQRGWYFAGPLRLDAAAIGVVAVKADMDAVEDAWREEEGLVFFTDPDGVVFVSNRHGLVFRSRAPLAEDARARIEEARRYPGREIAPMPVMARAPAWDGGDLGTLSLEGPDWAALDVAMPRAVMASAHQPRLGMTGHALIDVAPPAAAAKDAGLAAGAAALAMGALLLLLVQRRDAARRRLAIETRARDELERRVDERTRDLTAANAALEGEIAERRAAEEALRRAQADLVQAGKLSALGQMSAGISHELNQPLAAIRNFAENGAVYLSRGRPEKAAGNLERIAELTARMDRIIRNLRAFARKEGEPAADVDLGRVAADALALMDARIAAERVAVRFDPPPEPVMVRGGQVRLQQVALNLIGNALDAMSGQQAPELEIEVAPPDRPGAPARLSVRDRGPGLAQEAEGRMFDPFFTTKPVGEGTGLGLSISYGIVQSFGGRIRGRDRDGGGAVFTVELQPSAAAAASASIEAAQ